MVKTKVDDILKGHSDDCPGYKELKKQKRRLGTSLLTNLTRLFLHSFIMSLDRSKAGKANCSLSLSPASSSFYVRQLC